MVTKGPPTPMLLIAVGRDSMDMVNKSFCPKTLKEEEEEEEVEEEEEEEAAAPWFTRATKV